MNPAGYTVKVTAHDGAGKVVGIAMADFPFALGSDAFYSPVCGHIEIDPQKVERSLDKGDSAEVNVRLISHDLAVTYAITNVIAHVDPDPEQGTVAKNSEATVVLTLNCGDDTGLFPADLELQFRDEDGHLLDAAVPPAINVELTCLQGGVVAARSRPGQRRRRTEQGG